MVNTYYILTVPWDCCVSTPAASIIIFCRQTGNQVVEVWGNMPMARELPASSGSISSLLPVQPVHGEKQVHMVTQKVGYVFPARPN